VLGVADCPECPTSCVPKSLASLPSARSRLREFRAPAQAAEHRLSKTRQALSLIVNGITAVVIALAIFLALANTGLISRPASEDFTFGG
jgi:hypothetical protein